MVRFFRRSADVLNGHEDCLTVWTLSHLHCLVSLHQVVDYPRNLLSWHSQLSLEFLDFIGRIYTVHLLRVEGLFRCFILEFICLLNNWHWSSKPDSFRRRQLLAYDDWRVLVLLLVGVFGRVLGRVVFRSLLRWPTHTVLVFIEVIRLLQQLMLSDRWVWIHHGLLLLAIRFYGEIGATVLFGVDRGGVEGHLLLCDCLRGSHFVACLSLHFLTVHE